MAERILLAWQRRHETNGEDDHDNDGYISVEVKGIIVLKNDFEGMPYHQMIKRLSQMARSRPKAEVHFMRLDQKPIPTAMQMEPSMVVLLRDDPVKYIRATSPPPQRIVLGKRDAVKVTDNTAIKLRPIRAGHDTIADAFGDEIYIRYQHGRYESPLTGRWELPANIGAWVRSVSSRWGMVPAQELIEKQKTRYFLPRAWNTSGPWISHDDLKKLYENYLKEKAECSTKHTATLG